LSLLDRALLSNDKDKQLTISDAQKIFGYFDKYHLIELFDYIFKGDQNKTLEIYRKIYDQGVEPRVFLNDFLEILYYFKNISYYEKNTKNFDLNTEEIEMVKKISTNLDGGVLLLFWQFTIKTLEELNIVADQNISVEMFLVRLLHIKSIKSNNINVDQNTKVSFEKKNLLSDIKQSSEPISQIKNITQEKNFKNPGFDENSKNNIKIKNLNDLIELCNTKKEIKLKYELENNVNLVSFENGRIEISINEKLEKDFIKILSAKLLEWTNKRWMISLSVKSGEKTKKESNTELKKKSLDNIKNSQIYKKILKTFSDAELVEVENKDE